jgi:N-acetylneuraminate synthase/sialic acid synthase
MSELTIGTRRISDNDPAYVCAELGSNHQGVVKVACQLIEAAAACGVSGVKLQKRAVDSLYTTTMLQTPYTHAHSFGPTYGAHRKALELNESAYISCRTIARSCGVDLFATAFDEPSVDFLLKIGVPAIKVASGGLTDAPLLDCVARGGVPIVLSTGAGVDAEIDRAVQILTRHTTQIALLHCTAAYPVRDWGELNLRCITTLRERYPDLVIGWSGHVSGIATAVAAYVLGARMIECHFTTNRANKGTDHAFSLEPVGLRKLVRDLERTRVAMGDGVKVIYESEKAPIAKMRRSNTPTGFQITGNIADVFPEPCPASLDSSV